MFSCLLLHINEKNKHQKQQMDEPFLFEEVSLRYSMSYWLLNYSPFITLKSQLSPLFDKKRPSQPLIIIREQQKWVEGCLFFPLCRERRLLSRGGERTPTQILLGSYPLHTCDSLTWFLTICKQQGRKILFPFRRRVSSIALWNSHSFMTERVRSKARRG